MGLENEETKIHFKNKAIPWLKFHFPEAQDS